MSANSYICDLLPYQPGLPVELVAREHGLDPKDIIKLASNENPLGPSPKALRAIARTSKDIHRYPEQYDLVQALARHLQVQPDSLIIGNGSNDIIDLIARTYLGAGDESVISQHAFAMYHIAIQSVGATTITAPAKDYGHDLVAMLGAITPKTKVVWIANPNNPTGTFIAYPVLKRFLARVPAEVLVVLDEAYYDYLDEQHRDSALEWIKEHPNLIVLRTFSKIYGLAGLRVGYGIASPGVAELINRVRLPFTSSNLAIAAAVAALGDTAFVAKSVANNTLGREQLLQGLRKLGYECLPAYGNFVTCRVPNAAAVYQKLLRQGIIVRPLGGYDMPDWLRVSVGLPHENKRFLDALISIE